MAKLYFRFGEVKSGKTSSLFIAHGQYKWRGDADTSYVIVPKGFEHEYDEGKPYLCPRNVKERILINKLLETSEDIIIPDGICQVFIDEAQNLTEMQVNQLKHIAMSRDIPIMCYGLRTASLDNRRVFTGSKRLLELSDKIEEIKSICSVKGCKRKPVTSQYMGDTPDQFICQTHWYAFCEEHCGQQNAKAV